MCSGCSRRSGQTRAQMGDQGKAGALDIYPSVPILPWKGEAPCGPNSNDVLVRLRFIHGAALFLGGPFREGGLRQEDSCALWSWLWPCPPRQAPTRADEPRTRPEMVDPFRFNVNGSSPRIRPVSPPRPWNGVHGGLTSERLSLFTRNPVREQARSITSAMFAGGRISAVRTIARFAHPTSPRPEWTRIASGVPGFA